MKCDKCWFCTHIGPGIFAEYPVKYCKHKGEYKLPIIQYYEDGKITKRQLDLGRIEDCKIWHETGCNIHPNTVAKAKRKYIKELEETNEK